MLNKSVTYFLEAARCLNFSQAARRCFISQQAMTWHIAQLEAELGVKLFVRSTRSIQLTEAGIYLRDEFSRINDEISIAVSHVQSMSEVNRSVVNIGFYQSFDREHIILPIMRHLEFCYPDIYFSLHLMNLGDLLLDLTNQKLDIIVTTSYTWKLWGTLNVLPLKHYPFRIVMSKDHPAAGGPITQEVLSGLTLLTTEQPSQYNSEYAMRNMPKWRQNLPHKNYSHLPDINALLVSLEMGKGFALLTDELENVNSNPNLCSFDLSAVSGSSDAGSDMICCYPKGPSTAALREYARSISSVFQSS